MLFSGKSSLTDMQAGSPTPTPSSWGGTSRKGVRALLLLVQVPNLTASLGRLLSGCGTPLDGGEGL